jgi:cbb3-type cytochrome oxidase maturation protein
MSAIFLLIGASLLVALGFLFAFLWAAKKGQFDDTDTPSMRVLHEDRKVTDNGSDNAD